MKCSLCAIPVLFGLFLSHKSQWKLDHVKIHNQLIILLIFSVVVTIYSICFLSHFCFYVFPLDTDRHNRLNFFSYFRYVEMNVENIAKSYCSTSYITAVCSLSLFSRRFVNSLVILGRVYLNITQFD